MADRSARAAALWAELLKWPLLPDTEDQLNLASINLAYLFDKDPSCTPARARGRR